MDDQRLSGPSKLVLSLAGLAVCAGFGCMGRVQDLYNRYQAANPSRSFEIRQEYLSSDALTSSAHLALYPAVFSLFAVGATEAVRKKED